MTDSPQQILSPDQLCAWLGARGFHTSVVGVRRLLTDGALPGYKLGQLWVTPLPALERWMAGLPTIWSPALISALRAIELGEVQEGAAGVPSPFIRRREAA